MGKIQFNAETRDAIGKGAARKLRAGGFIPGILYGAGDAPCAIKLEKKSTENIIRKLESHNVMADLMLKDGEKGTTVKTMLKDIQQEPIKRDVLHLDFYRIRMDQPVRMEVAIHLVGESPCVEKGVILEQELRELQVQALPDKIPPAIEVDISKLEVGDSILVKDIELAGDVEVTDEEERLIVAVLAPKVSEEEEEEEEAAVVEEVAEVSAEPEVITEKEAEERRKEKDSAKKAEG